MRPQAQTSLNQYSARVNDRMTPIQQRDAQPVSKHILTTENGNLDSAMSDISDGNEETNVENGTRATPMPHTTLPKLMCD